MHRKRQGPLFCSCYNNLGPHHIAGVAGLDKLIRYNSHLSAIYREAKPGNCE